MVSQLTFNSGSYFKSLSNYELETLRNPRTEEDKEIFDSLPESVQKQIKESNKTGASVIRVPLGKEKMLAVFYKKQDYEPFAIPMGFPVLEDINYKQELKKMDMAISRTMQQAILLITMGAKEEEGGINQKAMTAMQELFKHETVGRVLIADYTTKAEFIVPKISELLDPKKYEVVDRDINIGLNNILVGGEKFSNQSSKVEVFLGRLRQGRESFINNFLLPEIKNIAKSLGFKSFPTPYYEDFSLKDDSNSQRIYTRLVELGVLTPQEGLTAIETGRLPDKESSLVSQRENMDFREEGLYQPLIGAPIQEPKGDAEEQDVKDPNSSKTKVKISKTSGRPNGTSGIKQSTKKISPIGASYSCAKIRDNLIQYSKLYAEVESELKRIFNLKEFNDAQKETAEEITRTIILNEESDKWTQSVAAYVKNPKDNNPERLKKAMEIGSKHGLDLFLSSILMESEI
jgi:hypothetical protein